MYKVDPVEQAILTPEAVKELMMDCLSEENMDQSNLIVVNGITRAFGFQRDKIAARRKDIRNLLMQLHPTFRKSVGGGWSFVYMTARGENVEETWGGQIHAEELFCLGVVAELASCLVSREFWPSLPYGVPYIGFDDTILVD